MPNSPQKDLPLCIQCNQCGGTVALRLTLDEQVCQCCQAKDPFSDSTLQAIQRARQKLRKRSRAEQNIQSTIGGRDNLHEFYTVILVTPLWLIFIGVHALFSIYDGDTTVSLAWLLQPPPFEGKHWSDVGYAPNTAWWGFFIGFSGMVVSYSLNTISGVLRNGIDNSLPPLEPLTEDDPFRCRACGHDLMGGHRIHICPACSTQHIVVGSFAAKRNLLDDDFFEKEARIQKKIRSYHDVAATIDMWSLLLPTSFFIGLYFLPLFDAYFAQGDIQYSTGPVVLLLLSWLISIFFIGKKPRLTSYAGIYKPKPGDRLFRMGVTPLFQAELPLSSAIVANWPHPDNATFWLISGSPEGPIEHALLVRWEPGKVTKCIQYDVSLGVKNDFILETQTPSALSLRSFGKKKKRTLAVQYHISEEIVRVSHKEWKEEISIPKRLLFEIEKEQFDGSLPFYPKTILSRPKALYLGAVGYKGS